VVVVELELAPEQVRARVAAALAMGPVARALEARAELVRAQVPGQARVPALVARREPSLVNG
jgi:hypothetical protein